MGLRDETGTPRASVGHCGRGSGGGRCMDMSHGGDSLHGVTSPCVGACQAGTREVGQQVSGGTQLGGRQTSWCQGYHIRMGAVRRAAACAWCVERLVGCRKALHNIKNALTARFFAHVHVHTWTEHNTTRPTVHTTQPHGSAVRKAALWGGVVSCRVCLHAHGSRDRASSPRHAVRLSVGCVRLRRCVAVVSDTATLLRRDDDVQ